MSRGQSSALLKQEDLLITAEIQPTVLAEILPRLREARKYEILDLGRLSGGTLEFFSALNCRIVARDIFESIVPKYRRAEPWGISGPDQDLAFAKGTRFDVIMLWDIVDYLSQKDAEELVGYLRNFCASGSLLYLVQNQRRTISDLPGIFRIEGSQRIMYTAGSSEARDFRPFAYDDLRRITKGFVPVRSIRHPCGFYEELLVLA